MEREVGEGGGGGRWGGGGGGGEWRGGVGSGGEGALVGCNVVVGVWGGEGMGGGTL